jgi:hypothetical protein
MKKMLLAGIAALSVLYASAASAQEPKVELPDSMVGLWCYAKDISTDTEDHYLEPYGDDGDENCGDGIFDRIKIWKDDDGSSGYSLDWFLPGWHSHCSSKKSHHPQARAHDGRRRDRGERAGQGLGVHGAPAGRCNRIIRPTRIA